MPEETYNVGANGVRTNQFMAEKVLDILVNLENSFVMFKIVPGMMVATP